MTCWGKKLLNSTTKQINGRKVWRVFAHVIKSTAYGCFLSQGNVKAFSQEEMLSYSNRGAAGTGYSQEFLVLKIVPIFFFPKIQTKFYICIFCTIYCISNTYRRGLRPLVECAKNVLTLFKMFFFRIPREKKNTGKNVGIMTKKMALILFHTYIFF